MGQVERRTGKAGAGVESASAWRTWLPVGPCCVGRRASGRLKDATKLGWSGTLGFGTLGRGPERGVRGDAGWGGKEAWAASGWAERKGTGQTGLIAGLPGLIAGPNGSVGTGWAREEGLGWVLVSSSSFLFYFEHHSNLFEFKSNLNSNSYALKQLKLMHQHECNNEFNLEKI